MFLKTKLAGSSIECCQCKFDQSKFLAEYLPKSVRHFAHNVLMAGSPGSGKTLLARALPGILPEMSIEESLEVTRIYSVADQLPVRTPLIRHLPFRAPLPMWLAK